MIESKIIESSNKKEIKELSSNIFKIDKQVKSMKFEEMYERMKILQYEKNSVIDKNVLLQTENDELRKSLEEMKKDFEKLEKEQLDSTNKIKNLIEEIQKDQEILTNNREKIRGLNKNLNDFLEILEYNNSKSLANVKLMIQLYKNDDNISNTIKNYVMKNIKKYNKNENPIKRELKKNSLFLEEFAKLIVYLNNAFQEKNDKIKNLHNSVKISQIMANKNNMDSMKDVILSESEEKPYDNLNELKLNELSENIQFLMDKLSANEKVENLEKMESLKDKLQKSKSMIKEMGKNESEMKEILAANKTKINKQNNLLLRVFLLIENILPKEILQGSEKSIIEQNQKDQNYITMNTLEDNFDYFGYEEKCKNNLKKLTKEIEDLKKDLEEERNKEKNPVAPVSNEKVENMYKLQNDIRILERERDDFKTGFEDSIKKVEVLRKQNKELLRNHQKKVVFENTREKILEEHSLRKYDDLKMEIDKKAIIIQGLIKANNKMTDRLHVLQTSRLEVLRDKQHCENLYLYFNKKSTDIFLMNEKLAKIVKENKKLRRFIEELFNLLSENVNISTEDLNISEKEFDSALDELKNAIFLATGKKKDFDPSLFNQYLINKGKEVEFATRKREIGKNIANPSAINPLQIQRENDYKKVQDALNNLNQNNVKERDIHLLKKLNEVLVENKNLSIILNTQKAKFRDLNKDLMKYKKKAKIISLMEPKIEKMVMQNMELKDLLLKIQNSSLLETEVNSNRAINYNNQAELSGELLEKLIEKIRGMNVMIKNQEKKVLILEQRKAEMSLKMEKIVSEYEIELTNSFNIIKDKNDIILQNDIEIGELKKYRDLIDSKENEVSNLKKELDTHEKTINILENNLKDIREKSNTDKDKMKGELKLHVNKITTKASEQADLLDKKYRLENECQALKEKIMNMDELIKTKENFIESQKERLKSSKIENQKIINDNIEKEKKLYEVHINLKTLEEENESLKKELKENKDKITSYLDDNSKFISDERKNIFDKLNEQFLLKIKKLEDQLYETQRDMNENIFKLEKQNKEITDLQSKLKMKNKQLIQFNSYINSMSDTSNPQLTKLSRLLIQNKSLLREIEHLRNKNKQLQSLYKNLQDTLDNKQISPPSQIKQKYDKKIDSLKTNFDTLYIDNYNLKCQFDVLVNCYEEKLKEINNDYDKLNNDLIKEKDLALKNEESYSEQKNKNNDLKMDIEGFKEENFALLQSNNNYLRENYNLKNKFKELHGDVALKKFEEERKILIENEKLNSEKDERIKDLSYNLEKSKKELEKLKKLYEEKFANKELKELKILDENFLLKKEMEQLKISSPNIHLQTKTGNLDTTKKEELLLSQLKLKDEEIKSLNDLLKKKEEDIKTFKYSKNNKQEGEVLENHTKIQDLNKEKLDLLKELEAKNKEIKNLNDLLKKNQEKLLEERNLNEDEKRKNNNQIIAPDIEIKTLNDKVEYLKKHTQDNGDLKNNNTELQKKNSELKLQILKLEDQIKIGTPTTFDEKKLLEKKNKLEKEKIELNENFIKFNEEKVIGEKEQTILKDKIQKQEAEILDLIKQKQELEKGLRNLSDDKNIDLKQNNILIDSPKKKIFLEEKPKILTIIGESPKQENQLEVPKLKKESKEEPQKAENLKEEPKPKDNLEEILKKKKDLEDTIVNLQIKKNLLKENVTQITEEKKILEKENAKLNKEKIADFKNHKKETERLKEKFEYKDKKIEELNLKWKAFMLEEEKLNAEIADLKFKNYELVKKMIEVEKSKKEIKQPESIKTYLEEIKKLNENNVKLNGEIILLQSRLKLDSEKINTLTNENFINKKMIEVYKSQNQNLESEFEEFDETLAEIENLMENNLDQASKNLIDLYKKDKDSVQKKFDEHKLLYQEIYEKFELTNKEYISTINKKENEIIDLKQKLLLKAA